MISVVVPTRDRPASLARCLRALAAQTVAVEVIVVDDRSRDGAAVRDVAGDAGATLLVAEGRGPAAARNLGASTASGEVICFLDDDCEPEPLWASTLASAALEAGSAAGRTVNAIPGSPLASASQLISNELTRSSFDPATGRLGFAASCNLAVAASQLGRLRFDERFPRAGGEDREWSARAFSLGLAPVPAAAAVVLHHQQLTLAGFARRQLNYGRGALRFRLALRRASPNNRPRTRGLHRELVRAGFRDGAATGLMMLSAQALTAAGLGLEALSALQQRLSR